MATQILVSGFVTGVSADSISFTWFPPVDTGTTTTLVPSAYVLCYSFSATFPEQDINIAGPLYEQYSMELLTELPGNTTSYNLYTTNPDFYQDAFWGIYPVFSGSPGSMFFASTYAGSAGFNRLELNEPYNMAINTSNNSIYFVEEGWRDSTNTNHNKLIGKLNDEKSLSHINGDIGISDTSTTYLNNIAVNSATNKLLRTSSYTGQKITIYNLANNTIDYEFQFNRIAPVVDAFVWNNKFYIRGAQGNYAEGNPYITGIFEVDASLNPSSTGIGPAGGGTQVSITTYAKEVGSYGANFYERTLSHPTAFANIVEGQVVEQYNAIGFVKEKVNSTTIKIIIASSSTWTDSSLYKFKFFPLKLHMGRILNWGVNSSNQLAGTSTQPINTDYWNTVIDTNNVTYTKGFVYLNNYNVGKKSTLASIDLQNKTFTLGESHTMNYVRRVLRGGTEAGIGSFADYALTSDGTSGVGTKIYKLIDGVWTLFTSAGYNEYLRDIIWSAEDNCFYATYRIIVGSTLTYDIKKITVDGLIIPIEVPPEAAGGEDKKPTDGDGDTSGGAGTGLGNNDFTADIPEADDPTQPPTIIVKDPDGNTIGVVPVIGLEPNTIITFRKLVDKFYLLQNGKIIWTYLLSPKQLYHFTSTGYIGWYNKATGEPIETPPQYVNRPSFGSLYYIFDAVLEEPGYSSHPMLDGYRKLQGQCLVIFEDDSIFVDRIVPEEYLRDAKYVVYSGRNYNIGNNQIERSPLLPRWVIDIVGASDYYNYIKEVIIGN